MSFPKPILLVYIGYVLANILYSFLKNSIGLFHFIIVLLIYDLYIITCIFRHSEYLYEFLSVIIESETGGNYSSVKESF